MALTSSLRPLTTICRSPGSVAEAAVLGFRGRVVNFEPTKSLSEIIQLLAQYGTT